MACSGTADSKSFSSEYNREHAPMHGQWLHIVDPKD